jgi:sugar lactone lactonase YvrE
MFWLLACTQPLPPAPGDDSEPSEPSSPSEPDPETETGTPTGDTGTTTPLDCSTLPPVPVEYETLQDFTRAEDFDFDAQGRHVSIQGRDLIGKTYDGAVSVISPNVGFSTAGTRALVTGDFIVADSGVGGIILVDGDTGGQQVIASNFNYPNGVEVDALNRAYVADQDRGKVIMIDIYSGDQGTVAEGLQFPNGVILSPDEQTLYVGSFGGGKIYAIDRLGDTEWDEERVLYEVGANGGFDGINVDACGNVYITEYTTGRVYRVTPDGSEARMVVDLPSGWIPNMRWGHEIGGWRSDILYVADRNQASRARSTCSPLEGASGYTLPPCVPCRRRPSEPRGSRSPSAATRSSAGWISTSPRGPSMDSSVATGPARRAPSACSWGSCAPAAARSR